MSGINDDIIFIRATSKRNGLTSILIGVAGLALASALLSILPKSAFLAGIFLLSASLVALLIGWFKLREPEHSLELTKQEILYRHRHGSWHLDWDNVQRIDTPKIAKGLEQAELGMVGIKLKDYRPVLDSISPRLVTNLLLEQRPLLLQSATCTSGTCYSADMLEDDKFKFADGTVITGIKAMMANRMKKLRELLGYDLYISAAELDRSADDFVGLLKRCQSQVLVQQRDH